MPITYEVDAKGWVLSRATGELDVPTVRAHLERLAEDSARATPLCELLDARDATSISFWSADVRNMIELARQLRTSLGDARVAFVANNDTVYGMGRVGQALAELSHLTFGVFRDREEALRWLEEVERGSASR